MIPTENPKKSGFYVIRRSASTGVAYSGDALWVDFADSEVRQHWAYHVDMNSEIISRDPDVLGGTPVFRNTRVPVRILFDYLEAGDSIDVFLDEYPHIPRDLAVAALELAKNGLVGDSEAAA